MNEIIIKIQYQYEIEDFIDFQQYIQLRNAHRNKSKIGYLFLIPFIVVFLNLIIIRIDYLLLLNYLSLFCVIIFFNIYNNRNKNTKYQIKSLKKIYPFANFAKSYEIIFYNNKLEIFHNNIIESTVGYNEIKECKNAKKVFTYLKKN